MKPPSVRPLLAALVVAAIVFACLGPALAMLVDSLRGADGGAGPQGWSLDAYRGVLREERQWTLLLRSVLVAAVATALALVWGIPVGYAAARLRGVRGAAVETLSYLPLLLPSLVIALGWMRVLGQAGIVTGWLESWLGLERAPIDLCTPAGAAFVQSLATFPFVSILAAQGFRALDPAALRAARLFATPGRVMWHVVRPQLLPYVAGGAFLVFVTALGDFGVPSALQVNVYPIEVFTAFSAHLDPRRAIASCVPPVVLVALLFVLRRLLARTRSAPPAMASAAPVDDGAPVSRLLLAFAGLALVLAVGVPIAFLLATARGAFVPALRTAGDQVLNSLEVAALGTAFLMAAGLAFALAHRALSRRGRAVAELAVLLPLLVPGAAVGLGILQLVAAGAWPLAAAWPGASIVAYASAARFVAFPALILAAAAAGVRAELLHAAAVHGVPRRRVATGVVVPLSCPALAAAATVSFLLALGELPAAVLVNPPGAMTLPVRLASLLHFGQDHIVASLCLTLVALVATVLALGLLLAGRPLRLRLPHEDRAA